MKKRLFQTLCGALVALLCMSLASCDKINAWLDNPVTIHINLGGEGGANGENGEDSQSVPVKFTTAVEQLKIAKYEGAYITFWFTHQGGLYYAIFKKVGDDYVLQNDVASTRITDRAFTRGEVDDDLGIAHLKLIYDKITGSLELYVNENVKKDDGSMAEKAVLQTSIETQTGNIEQRTEDISSRVIAVETGIQAPDNIHVQRVESGAVNLMCRGEVRPEERGAVIDALNGGKLDHLMVEARASTLRTIAEINQQVNQENGVTDVAKRADAADVLKALEEAEKKVEEMRKRLIDAGNILFRVHQFMIKTRNLTLQVGQSQQIEYTIGPSNANKTIVWSSDKESVATVDKNGVVKAISEGSAKITGRPLYGSQSLVGSCTCTVKGGAKPEPKAGEISFGEKTVSLTWSATASENVYQQEATVTGDAVPTYSISDNSCGAQIDPRTGKVTFTKAGSVTVTAKVNNTDAYTYATNTASYTLTVTEPEPGGIDPHDGFGDGGDPLK